MVADVADRYDLIDKASDKACCCPHRSVGRVNPEHAFRDLSHWLRANRMDLVPRITALATNATRDRRKQARRGVFGCRHDDGGSPVNRSVDPVQPPLNSRKL
jgi:hypothetical protein